MNSNIFIPKNIKVGFQNRSDTYTKKLAYIIYTDEKGVLRKEKSWNSWRDKEIEPIEYANEPTSGFVLNKHVGGYDSGWNHRNSYIRIFDSRGFEFEITLENLLYILENTNSIKGKGLEGEFVYGWYGKDLLLIPTESPDYIEIKKFNEIIHENKLVKAKELIVGATYKTKDGKNTIYLGKYNYNYYGESKGNNFWFCDVDMIDDMWDFKKFTQRKTLGKYLIDIVNKDCHEKYSSLVDDIMVCKYYSPIDDSKTTYNYYELEQLKDRISKKIYHNDYPWHSFYVYSSEYGEPITKIEIKKNGLKLKVVKKSTREVTGSDYWRKDYKYMQEYDEILLDTDCVETIFNTIKPKYLTYYLKNGKLLKGVKDNEKCE